MFLSDHCYTFLSLSLYQIKMMVLKLLRTRKSPANILALKSLNFEYMNKYLKKIKILIKVIHLNY